MEISFDKQAALVTGAATGMGLATARAFAATGAAVALVDIDADAVKREADELVANAVLWLCSPLASFVIGHALAVDGGYTVQ